MTKSHTSLASFMWMKRIPHSSNLFRWKFSVRQNDFPSISFDNWTKPLKPFHSNTAASLDSASVLRRKAFFDYPQILFQFFPPKDQKDGSKIRFHEADHSKQKYYEPEPASYFVTNEALSISFDTDAFNFSCLVPKEAEEKEEYFWKINVPTESVISQLFLLFLFLVVNLWFLNLISRYKKSLEVCPHPGGK